VPRAVAPGLIQGALRGLIAGVFAAALLLAVLAVTARTLPPEVFLGVGIGLPLVAAFMGGADGLESRIPRGGNLVRGLAPVLGGMFAAMIFATLDDLVAGARAGLPSEKVLEYAGDGALSAIPVGLGMLAAGGHQRGSSLLERVARALRASVFPFLVSLVVALYPDPIAIPLLPLSVLAVAVLLVLGHTLARPMGRSVGRWLEEERSWATRLDAGERYRELARKAAEARRLAESATGAKRALHVASGLEEAREAYDTVDAAHLELPREEARRALAWFLRQNGQVDEAARLDR
jgi:hypothetical protein